ncbi:unnamed protein product, partial [Staurois parvus]
SWGPPCPIGDHGAPVSLPKLKKAYEKGTRGISWGPLLTPGPRSVPEFPNGQSAPPAAFIKIIPDLFQQYEIIMQKTQFFSNTSLLGLFKRVGHRIKV